MIPFGVGLRAEFESVLQQGSDPAQRMEMKMITEAQFAKHCAFISRSAAAWASDILSTSDDLMEASDPDAVSRFTDEMRGRLSRLDLMNAGVEREWV